MNAELNFRPAAPGLVKLIAVLMTLTIFRAQTILFLPNLEMYGGVAPNGWFGPWLSDFLIGLLVPVAVFLAIKRTGTSVWGFLVLYNALGAFDYTQGLITQWISPLPVSIASEVTVYLGIYLFLICQIVALWLLFRQEVIGHFCGRDSFVCD